MKRVEFFLVRFCLFLVLAVLLGTFSSIIGYFKIFAQFVLPTFFLGFLIWIFFHLNNFKIFEIHWKEDFGNYQILVIVGILIFCILNGIMYHEIVDGDRDDGVFALSAVYLAKNGTIFSHEEDLYFTGFTKIKTDLFILESLPGYTNYLAIFYFYGGFLGLFLANSLLLFLSLFLIFKVGDSSGGFKIGLITLILFTTHYTTFWFSRRTDSENMLLFLFWLVIFFVYQFIKNKDPKLLSYCILPLSLIFLTRPEGILYILMFFLTLIIISLKKIKKIFHIARRSLIISFLFYTLVPISLLLASIALLTEKGVNYWGAYNSYKIILLGTIERFKEVIFSRIEVIKQIHLSSGETRSGMVRTPYVYQDFTTHSTRYVIDVLINYFILPPLIFAIVFFKRIFNFKILVLLIMAIPSFIYLINPQITPDHPWMMRRYWPILIPLIYLLFSYVISQFKKRQVQIAIVSIGLLINIILSAPIIVFSEGRGSLAELKSLNNKLANADFLFFGGRSGRWASSFYFIYDKKSMTGYTARENFIPPLKKYQTVYVVSSNPYNFHPLIPDFSLELIEKYSFRIPRLKPSLTEIDTLKTFEYSFIKDSLADVPPKQIFQETHQFNILKLTSKDFLQSIELENTQ